MATTTLTLTTDDGLVRQLERIAADRNTDVNSLVTALLENYARASTGRSDPPRLEEAELPPITRSALGLLKGLPARPWKDLLTDALMDKYGFAK
jgi:hypothetical protein